MRLVTIFLLLVWLCACTTDLPKQKSAARSITIYVTVDWEGWSLEEENLRAMRDFRNKHPDIPMLQLLNPVYLLRQNVDVDTETQKIRSTFLPQDTLGLHVHGWKSLMDVCGVPYRSTPSYAGEKEDCMGGECGYTVSLEYAYSSQDLSQLIGCSANMLEKQGFGRPQYFRAGGWQLGDKLAQALEVNRFTWDSSRIDATLLTTRWAENSGLVKMLRNLHPNSTPLDQPYPLTAHVIEYPNNGALADYTSPQQLLDIFKQLLAHQKQVFVLGFHQETADAYLYNLDAAIPMFEQAAREAGVNIVWASRSID